MKIIFHSLYQKLNKDNFMFMNTNISMGDNLLTPMVRIKEYFESKNISVCTSDVISIYNSDAIIFIDMPSENDPIFIESVKLKKLMYLLIYEAQIIRPTAYNLETHKLFKKVFTWSDDLINIDSKKYIKINFSFDISDTIYKNIQGKEKLCCLISGNKKSNHINELYSERVDAIRWFEKNHLDEFDLFGIGWKNIAYGENRYINYILRKSPSFTKFFSRKFLSYKGSIERKKPILEKYKFSICYENIKDVPGYITEKIFDSFFAGCIPIYLGANNISEYIPSNCFIDKRKFTSYEDLYNYIKNVSDDEYMEYLSNIEYFLNSDKSIQFSNDYFAKTLLKEFI